MRPEMRDLAGLYAVGALSPEEAADFEAYLETTPEARAEVAEFLATTSELGEAEAEPPPDELKSRVLADVANTRQEPPVVTALAERRPRWRRLAPTIAAAAAIVLLAVAGAVGIGLGNRVQDLEADQAVLTATDAVTVELDGTDGSLRVVWSEEEGKLAVIGEAPRVGDDQTYELWRLGGDRVEAVGLFRPDGDGVVFSVIESADLFSSGRAALAVTVEAAGGADAPTGDIVFLSAG